MVIEGEDWFEITLPAAKLERLPVEEEKKVLEILTRAVGKEPRVKYIGRGKPPFKRYLLIVLDESENLEQLKFADVRALVSKSQVWQSSPPMLKTPPEFGCRKRLVSKAT